MENDFKTVRVIFLHKDARTQSNRYLILDDECINDGRPAQGSPWLLKAKIGRSNPGFMFSAESNGKTLKYATKPVLLDVWKNEEDLLSWQIKHRNGEDTAKLLKEATRDDLKELLAPFRHEYLLARDRSSRSALIARVIDYITYG